MTANSHRIAYEALKHSLTEAELGPDHEAHDRALAALDAFVASVVTDPRKLRGIALDSPGCAAEIQARAAELSLPRQVLDPTFDPSFARLWLASLDDTKITMLHRVMAEEMNRRDGRDFAPRRRGSVPARA